MKLAVPVPEMFINYDKSQGNMLCDFKTSALITWCFIIIVIITSSIYIYICIYVGYEMTMHNCKAEIC